MGNLAVKSGTVRVIPIYPYISALAKSEMHSLKLQLIAGECLELIEHPPGHFPQGKGKRIGVKDVAFGSAILTQKSK